MKLLVVGHSYLTAFAQRKYVEMKRHCEGLELRILAPHSITHVLMPYTPNFSASGIVDTHEFFELSHMPLPSNNATQQRQPNITLTHEMLAWEPTTERMWRI
jgi:hypothetical protein